MSAESQQEYKLQIARTQITNSAFISCCLSVMLFYVIKTFRGKSVIGDLQQIKTATVMERGKTKDLMGTCVLKLCTFLSRPLQNDNLKSPKFVSFSNGNRDGKLFQFPFGTCRCLHTLDWS